MTMDSLFTLLIYTHIPVTVDIRNGGMGMGICVLGMNTPQHENSVNISSSVYARGRGWGSGETALSNFGDGRGVHNNIILLSKQCA